MALTAAEGTEPLKPHYPLVYAGKVAVVCATLAVFRRTFTQFPFALSPLAIAAGVAGVVMWVAVEKFVPYRDLLAHIPGLADLLGGARAAYNPMEALADPAARWAFITVRMFGLSVMVPIMEEVFWRGLGLRYIVAEDFESVPMGKTTPGALAAVTVAFALVHPELLPAALYAVLTNFVLIRTGSLWACIQTHAVTNFLLGAYVLATGDWVFW
jgi:CAAX prenyl protease-like protein